MQPAAVPNPHPVVLMLPHRQFRSQLIQLLFLQSFPPIHWIVFAVQLLQSRDAIRMELFRSHKHSVRPRPGTIITVNNHDAEAVHVMQLGVRRQIVYLGLPQFMVRAPFSDGSFVSGISHLDLS